MTRRHVALGLVAFICALCLGVPLAFHAGWASAGRSAAPHFSFAWNLTPKAPFEGLGTEHFSDCYRQVRLPAIRQFDRIQDCRQGGEGLGRRIAGWAAEAADDQGSLSNRNGPLRLAFAAVIAGGSSLPLPPNPGGADRLGADRPFDLAMAPGEASQDFSTSSLRLPGNLIPPGGFVNQFAPPLNPSSPSEPHALETPIPGALPLLLTGLVGIGAARRRKSKR